MKSAKILKSANLRIVFLCLLGMFVEMGCSDERAADAVVPVVPQETKLRVRVATYNVHRLFDPICDSASCGGSSYEPAVSQEAYQEQIRSIGDSLWTVDADIVLLQEIEKESGIADLRTYLSETIYRGYAFGECGYSASLDVGILTRGEIKRVEKYRSGYHYVDASGKSRPLSRELLRADIEFEHGIRVTAFTTHLVSKVSDPDGARRRAEAEYVQQVVSRYIDENPGVFVVFGGDLNDTPGTEVLERIEKGGALIRDAQDLLPNETYTWNNSVAFDHLYHNATLDPYRTKTERVCNVNASTGLGSSDHCALKSTYFIDYSDES